MGTLYLKPLIFAKAGRATFIKYGSDGSLAWTPANMSTVIGAVESISGSLTTTDQKVGDGNSKFAAASVETDMEGKIEVVLNTYPPDVMALLAGATVTTITSETMVENGDEMTIPSTGPFTTTLKHTYGSGNFVLTDATGSPFTKVSSAPAAGQVSVSGTTATYNSADAGKEVLAIYEWTATAGSKWSLNESSNRPIVQAIITGEATDEDQLQTYDTNIIVDRCKAVGDLNPPQQQKQPQNVKLTVEVLKPRAGKQVVDWKAVPRS